MTPGVYQNTLRKNGAVRDARRMRGFDTACELLGGQSALATALGINSRLLRQKMSAERPISDAEVRAAVAALHARATRITELADALLATIAESAGDE